MKTVQISIRRQYLRTTTSLLITGLFYSAQTMPMAYAEDKANAASSANTITLDEIVVTGSRIKRAGFDTVQPAIVVDSSQVRLKAATNVGDLLNQQAGFALPGNSSVGGQSESGVGQTFVDFLGLGSQRTLTVINGIRFPGANTPALDGVTSPGLQVDLNTIPVALIDRIETIAIGGAPIYGTDAIAGTVNVILKKRFKGFDTTISTGISSRSDAPRFNVEAIYGFNFNDDKGNIVFSVQHSTSKGLGQTARAETAKQWFFAPPDPSLNSPYANIILPDQRVVVTNFRGIPLLLNKSGQGPKILANVLGGGVPTPDGGIYQFGTNGELIPFNTGKPTASSTYYSGGDGLNLAETEAIDINTTRTLANMLANYDFSDHLSVHLEGWYSNSRGRLLAQQPKYGGAELISPGETDSRVNTGPAAIRLDNPYVAESTRNIIRNTPNGPVNLDLNNDGIPETEGFFVDKGYQDLFRGSAPNTNQNFMHFLAQVNGNNDVFNRPLSWTLVASYGKSSSTTRVRGLLIDRFNQALDAVLDDNGKIVCRDQSSDCQPLNILGDGVASPEAIKFVTADTTNSSVSTQLLFSASVTGTLAKVPAGDFNFAFGADYRRETSSYKPDALSASGLLQGAPRQGIDGAFETREVYSELRLPLVSPGMNIPFVNRLDFEGAVRFVDNSIAGRAVTWTAGGSYAPISDIKFRGNYTKSIRAPAITELLLPTSQIEVAANDPCDAGFISQGNDPARRAANCAAAGVVQPFSSNITKASEIVQQVGNRTLKNEEAKAWSIGFVVQPRYVPKLSIAVDWIDIRLRNAIELLDAGTILNACYDSAGFPTADVCQRFGRDPNGQIINLTTGYANAGSLNFSGLTGTMAYPIKFGSSNALTLSVNYLYTKRNTLSITGTDTVERAGTVGNSKHRVNASAAFEHDDFGVFLQGQFISAPAFDNADGPTTRDIKGLNSWFVLNGRISYKIGDTFDMALNVDNIFDIKAPRYSSASGGAAYATYFSGLLGRYYTISAHVHF